MLQAQRARPWSARMKAIMARVLAAPDHTILVGPGHDFQTCMSLRYRGDLRGVVRGEAPKESILVVATSQGLTRARRELQQPVTPPDQRPVLWPFKFSSRGWHLPQPLAEPASAPGTPTKRKSRG